MTLDKNDPFCEVAPLQRAGSLADRVQDAVVELIISRTLEPGQHIVENDIAQRLGVSRQPVREALRSLNSHGWVEQRQGRGTFVHEPTNKEQVDVLHVRALLEAEAARLAADTTRNNKQELRALQRTIEDGIDAFEGDKTQLAISLDEQCHRKLAALSDNTYLRETLDKLARRARWYLQPILERRGRASWDELEQVYEAIASKKPDLAAHLIKHHTQATLDSEPIDLWGDLPSQLG